MPDTVVPERTGKKQKPVEAQVPVCDVCQENVSDFYCSHCGQPACERCFGANCCIDCADWEDKYEEKKT
jgi:hypothetical protein